LPTIVRVLLVDDHAIVREGLRSILELQPDISVVAEADSPQRAIEQLEQARPDLVLLDLKLGDAREPEGLALCSEILERRPETQVVIVSAFLDEMLLNEALRRGARAYVLKDVDVTGLIRIVRAVARGESGFDSRSAALVRAIAAGATKPRSPALTNREQQVVELLAQGLTNGEIGSRMYLSQSTVKFHLHNVMDKLGVHRRTEVAYAAGNRGLISAGSSTTVHPDR
jgi:DNA-binding NarL/FixJ family response regulator